MAKYSALATYLSNSAEDSIRLTFAQIEEIIGDRLPPSAKGWPAFWANEKTGTHIWAHLWRAAGWQKDAVDLAGQTVTFRRIIGVAPDTLEALRPQTKETIYDLLEQIGISTDEWLTTADGHEVSNPKANPNYCYDWSFGSLQEGFALCIWHGTLESHDGQIVFEENLRDLAVKLQAEGRNPANSTARKTRAITQSVRARTFDNAINASYARGLPVSVILTEGDRRSRDELGESSSQVLARSLDPIKWYVHKYDTETGDALLVRGIKPAGVSDDNADPDDEDSGQPDDVQQRAIKIRRGQTKFREQLLAAYGRVCAVTECKIVDLLEAAHIQPHAIEPNYSVTNGLLLRADIHTLFDLNLLSIDSRFRICLAPELRKSEYRCYDGKMIRLPATPSEIPSMRYLDQRYEDFKKSLKD